MKTPAYLRKGDTVGILAPARKIKYEEIEDGIKILEDWKLKVITASNTFKEYHQFSGTDKERAEDFQFMLDNDEVRAVFCARGGYGSVRIIDKLDFSRLLEIRNGL